MAVLPLLCPIQNYAWGSKKMIPELLQKDNPLAEPWAELWMGAHPRASSTDLKGRALNTIIAQDPKGFLGNSELAQSGRLPFLFKILAADSPLSIQAHPSKKEAKLGFAREESLGISLSASNRNYKDDNHKPELIVALGPFWALKGFRKPEKIAQFVRSIQLRGWDTLLAELDRNNLQAFFAALMQKDEASKKRLLQSLQEQYTKLPAEEAEWVGKLLEAYPGDIGAFAPIFLQLHCLQAGQAFYLPAGELHAYLHGLGLEIMANSDNVLRGGLTPKHVDVPELLKVLCFEYRESKILTPRNECGFAYYDTPCSEFSLRKLHLEEEEQRWHSSTPEILLCLGKAELAQETNSYRGSGATKSDPKNLSRGDIVYLSPEKGHTQIRGTGDFWIASFPEQKKD